MKKTEENTPKIDPNTKVIVIGGGPAGLMAAGQAALKGAIVTLLEKKDNPARKLRITGNGRCNITNAAPLEEFLLHYGRNGKFLRPAFAQFFSADIMRFFESSGVTLIQDERGRVYPKSNDANDVADALLKWTIRCGAKIVTDSQVGKIISVDGHIKAVQITNSGIKFPADIVIICAGGASYPATGSAGDGFNIAEALGHTIIPIRAASIPLITSKDIAPKLQGLSLSSVNVKIIIDGKTTISEKGDMIFTHYGVSGPAVLNISRFCVDQMKANKHPLLSIDIAPDQSDKDFDKLLLSALEKHGKGQIATVVSKFVPARMAMLLLSIIGIDPSKPSSQITASERHEIRHNLKEFEMKITGHRPLVEAMVTAGGINLKEVNPRTMESYLIKGLYFAGEVLDLDADTGGFNLQAAFSTGWLAGQLRTMHKNE